MNDMEQSNRLYRREQQVTKRLWFCTNVSNYGSCYFVVVLRAARREFQTEVRDVFVLCSSLLIKWSFQSRINRK